MIKISQSCVTMLASHLIEQLSSAKYDQTLLDLYLDESLLTYQKERYQNALQSFIDRYGDDEVIVLSTPGRSEICGNHTDHQHGEVIAAAINLDIIAVVKKADDIQVYSEDYTIAPIDLHDLTCREEEKGTSEALIRGIAYRFKEKGYHLGGLKAYMTSDVLRGSGLSSSAAFEVMMGTILNVLYNDGQIDPVTIAQIGQYSENVYFGKPCGLMDQCACAIGRLIHIDFQNPDNPFVEQLHCDFSAYGYSLCIVDVHADHADLTDEYAAIPREMKQVAAYFHKDYLREVDEKAFYAQMKQIRQQVSDRALLRAIHFFNEDQRVQTAVQALNTDDINSFLKQIEASGDSSYQYLQNVMTNSHVSHQAIPLTLACSKQVLQGHGVCRVHGGGFAGTTQAFVQNDFVETYRQTIDALLGAGSTHVLKIRNAGSIRVF